MKLFTILFLINIITTSTIQYHYHNIQSPKLKFHKKDYSFVKGIPIHREYQYCLLHLDKDEKKCIL